MEAQKSAFLGTFKVSQYFQCIYLKYVNVNKNCHNMASMVSQKLKLELRILSEKNCQNEMSSI